MITSVNNQKIKDTVRLRDSAKARREEGVFLVEGPRMFAETPPELIVRAFISESCEAAGEVCVPDGIDCETVTDTVYISVYYIPTEVSYIKGRVGSVLI